MSSQSITDKLESSVNASFIVGLIFSRLRVLPLPVLSGLFGFMGILACLIGYLFWFCASLFYPKHTPQNAWYGFAEFRLQYSLTATVGLAACMLCLTLLTYPVLVGLVLFNISNFIWCITEYHKLNHTSTSTYDARYSSKRQSLYIHYVFGMTASCLATSICGLLMFFSPPLVPTLTFISLGLDFVCITYALYYLSRSLQTIEAPSHSYDKFSQQLTTPTSDIIVGQRPTLRCDKNSRLRLDSTISTTTTELMRSYTMFQNYTAKELKKSQVTQSSSDTEDWSNTNSVFLGRKS